MKSTQFSQRQTQSTTYPFRNASPNQRAYYESPSGNNYDNSDNNTATNQSRFPVNLNVRANLLDQCNNQYEENFRNNNSSNYNHNNGGNPINNYSQNQAQYDSTFDRKDHSKERSNYYQSPYQNENSVSPVRENGREGIEETIQGNIDGAMTIQQIKNKKAFVWAFGKNQEGELALGVYKDALLPRFVTGVKGLTAKWISSSNHHTALITQEGQLLVSGSSLHGKLGIENLNKTNINKFQLVPSLSRKKAKQVSCGDYHTLCLMEEGTVYQFGGSLFKDKKDKIQRLQNPQQQIPPNVPQPIQALYGREIVQIDCGDFHSAALDANGDLYTWGGGAPSYNKGQCGHGHQNALEYPEKVKYLSSKRIIKVACGGFHTLALTSENELYSFGSGNYGECGYGEFLDTSKPKLVKFPHDQINSNSNVTDDLEEFNNDQEFVLEMYLKEQPMITEIAAGGRHSMVLTNKGRLYSFGYGTNGQLGLRNTSNFAKPQLVKDLIGKQVTQIAAGWNHSLAMTDKGDVYACGYGGHGQLGQGDKESRTYFSYIQSLGNKNIARIFAGGNHSWVVLDSVMPTRDKWNVPSPVKNSNHNDNSRSNTPHRPLGDFSNTIGNGQGNINQQSGSKPMNRSSISPFQQRASTGPNDGHPKQSQMSSATFGGLNSSFNQKQQPGAVDKSMYNPNTSQSQIIPQGDDFIQKIIEIQHQQLMKAQYFLQVTYCETEYCHRFVNFEVHGQFVKQFESMLEEYIQQSYQLEKGVLYHKVQEVPQEFLTKKASILTPGDRMIREQQNEFDNDPEYSDLDDSFTPEEGHKGYTLCLICNPNVCGYDDSFNEWKRNNGIIGKGKKIVVNSSSFQGSTGIRAVSGDENQAPLIGKIVFVKDSDIDSNPFEDTICKWMINFHRKLAKYCIKKPRYSELRPMKFSLT